jgi:methylated-DNA-[protein]-cysteine S-methyltransferase
METVWVKELAETPAGPLWVAVTAQGLAAVSFGGLLADLQRALARRLGPVTLAPETAASAPHTGAAAQQISDYLAGRRAGFDLPIDWRGLRPFQVAVLRGMLAIPPGQTCTYAELARRVGHPGAARAVGRASATNPLALVVPCHRMVGSDGRLHGYGGPGGIKLKAWLLDLEHKH